MRQWVSEIELSMFVPFLSLCLACVFFFFFLDELCQTTPSDRYIQSRVQLAVLVQQDICGGIWQAMVQKVWLIAVSASSPLVAVSRQDPVPWEFIEPLLSVIKKASERFECSIPSTCCRPATWFLLSRQATMSTTPSASSWYIQFCVRLSCFKGNSHLDWLYFRRRVVDCCFGF